MPDKTFQSAKVWKGSYSPSTKQLTVWFSNGQPYVYHKVPQSRWDDIAAMDDPHSYIQKQIRPNYRAEKVNP